MRRARIDAGEGAVWVDPDEVGEDAVWLPPLEGPPSKIIGTHLTYRSRAVEYAMAGTSRDATNESANCARAPIAAVATTDTMTTHFTSSS